MSGVGAWAALVAVVAAAERFTAAASPFVRMLALVGATFLGMKAVVLAAHARAGAAPLGPARATAFVLGWPGMRPAAFLERSEAKRRGAARALAAGALALGAGLTLVGGARLVLAATGSAWAATAPLLVGLSLMLHFGLFRLLEGGWRALGFPVERLFRAPLRARGLAEFWSRRWNLAFSQMTSIAVVRPTRGALGARAVTMLGFLVSGLLHEIAISLPVRAGFGLPTLYFTLHGALVVRERRARRALTIAALLLPLPLVFHAPFLAGVVWPLIGG